jgi:CDGSH-type Zn-finger protein
MADQSKTIEIKKGEKCKLCTCGSSKIIPFCDDSHRELNEKKGTFYKSLKIVAEEDVILHVSSKTWGTGF